MKTTSAWAHGLFVGLTVMVLGTGRCGETPSDPSANSLTIATYNIRFFGDESKDLPALQAVVRAVDPAVLALQEVRDDEAPVALASALSDGTRRYRAVSARCGGRGNLHVAFVYDEARVECVGMREFPTMGPGGDGSCSESDRAALAGTFVSRATQTRSTLVSVHLAAMGTEERVAQRKSQWKRLFALVDHLRATDGGAVVLLGDTNSTGWSDNAHDERRFIEEGASRSGLEIATRALVCSEYWTPRVGHYEPSMLDHVLADPGAVDPASVSVRGYCAGFGCQRVESAVPPREYQHVSDHCPVVARLR
ncbi:MAG: endonuclease/exonuclease/phosphatase family protein [Deltaproteobacteria bacterium]|nr:endonuclease/exonuclease/phosphatase family protein [Deltaproteobacteria bacterium]